MRIGLRALARGGMPMAVAVVALATGSTGSAQAVPGPIEPAWAGFAGNAQHTAVAPTTAQPFGSIHWQVPVDLHPDVIKPDGPISHYASPMISNANTVMVPTEISAKKGFEIRAYAGADGTKMWSLPTDYTFPKQVRRNFPPPLPASMMDDSQVAVAAAGGTILVRSQVDDASGPVERIAFYGINRYRAHRAVYRDSVAITTPLTAGADGSLYFGFSATKAAPGELRNGIARIDSTGHGSWMPARALTGTDHSSRVVLNCAPALSNNENTGYVAVLSGGASYLVGFDTTTLAAKYSHGLRDPQTKLPALVFESSSATPTVGPDGDVFYGVLGNPLRRHDDRGWLLHFDRRLHTVETPGSFGWDQTVSAIPSSAVPSYTGTSSYLLVSKYNNYVVGPHGDGRNELALLDPHAGQRDRFSRVRVMREVRTILSPEHPPHSPHGFRYEWCINSAAVDPTTGSVIANSEDGHLYRWDLESGQLVERIRLNKPRGQAYTETVVGPDGTSYAIENAQLYAVGS